MQQHATIFFGSGEEDTRFLNQTVDFTSCFERTSFTGTQGTAPILWDCDFGTGSPTKTDCWTGAGNSLTSLTNYSNIPEEWGATHGFITKWTVESGDKTITLPLTNIGVFNCTVSWGDGSATSTITTYDDADRIHEYATAGTYDVEITGECPGWAFAGAGDKLGK
jgi:hypothetical protein